MEESMIQAIKSKTECNVAMTVAVEEFLCLTAARDQRNLSVKEGIAFVKQEFENIGKLPFGLQCLIYVGMPLQKLYEREFCHACEEMGYDPKTMLPLVYGEAGISGHIENL